MTTTIENFQRLNNRVLRSMHHACYRHPERKTESDVNRSDRKSGRASAYRLVSASLFVFVFVNEALERGCIVSRPSDLFLFFSRVQQRWAKRESHAMGRRVC